MAFGACARQKMEWPVSVLRELPATDQPCDAEPVADLVGNEEVVPTPILSLRWPVYARGITSHFGIRTDPIMARAVRFHKGLDVSAPNGSLVYAAAAGIVISEGWAGGHGFQVVLDHGGGMRTSYSHLSLPIVSRGQRVQEATPIGVVGDTGRATGPHLHFEVRVNEQPLDPFPLLGGRLPTPEELLSPAPPRFVFAPVAAR